jgi:hypothetical protein
MVSVPPGSGRVDLTLPPAGNSTSRFVTVRRVNARGRVLIHAQPGERIEGWREPVERDERRADVLPLNTRADFVTLVSDGASWFVFAQGR